MRTLGRILLLVVGILLLVSGIPAIINSCKALGNIGWQNIFAQENMQFFVGFLSSVISCFFGVTAIFGFIRGRSSFWLTICSLVMIGLVIWYFISANNAGTLGDWKSILYTICGFALPIGYFLGGLLVKLGK